MPLPHELHAGDVVMWHNHPKTILSAQYVGVEQYAMYQLTFNDGQLALVDAARSLSRIHPPDDTTEPPSTTP